MKCRFHALDDAVWMIALGRLSDMHTEVMPVCNWCAGALATHKTYSFEGQVWVFDEIDKRKITDPLPKSYQNVTNQGETIVKCK